MSINRGLVKYIRIYPNVEMPTSVVFTMGILMYFCGKNKKNAVKVCCLWYGPIYVY